MTIDGLVIGLCGFVIGYATPAGVGIRPWFDVLGWLQKTATPMEREPGSRPLSCFPMIVDCGTISIVLTPSGPR